MKGGKDRWMNEWKKGWIVMDEWVDGMDRRMNEHSQMGG